MIAKKGPKMKTDIYAELYLLNKNADALVRVLQRIDALGVLPKQMLKAHELRLEELRATVNSEILETLLKRECTDQWRLSEQRTASERAASGEAIQ